MNKNILFGLIVFLFAAALYVPGLGALTLVDQDEPRFAEAGRVMLQEGGYVIPMYNGEVRYHKPPMLYWVMQVGYRLFGVNEFGARIASAVSGALACLLVYVIGLRMFNRRAALLAGLMAATTLHIFVMSRISTADGVLLMTIVAMFAGFWRVHQGRRNALAYLLMYGGLAVGSLTKGPVSIAVLIVALLLYVAWRRPAKGVPGRNGYFTELRLVMRETHLVLGILATAAAVMAWFVPAIIVTDGDFWTKGFVDHVFNRSFTEAKEGHSGIFGIFYLLILPAAFFPWVAVLPQSFTWLWKSEERGRRAFLLGWAIAPYLVFSFLRTQLPHYVLPAYPAFALICGGALDRAIAERRNLWAGFTGKLGLILFLIAGLGIAGGVVAMPLTRGLQDITLQFAIPAILAATMTTWAFIEFVRKNNARATRITAGFMAAVLLTLSLVTAPALNAEVTNKDVALALSEQITGSPVICCDKNDSSLVFYLQKTVKVINSPADLQKLVAENEGKSVYCISTKEKYNEAARAAGGKKISEFKCYALEKTRWRDVTIWKISR